jgi:hypothetical protein
MGVNATDPDVILIDGDLEVDRTDRLSDGRSTFELWRVVSAADSFFLARKRLQLAEGQREETIARQMIDGWRDGTLRRQLD